VHLAQQLQCMIVSSNATLSHHEQAHKSLCYQQFLMFSHGDESRQPKPTRALMSCYAVLLLSCRLLLCLNFVCCLGAAEKQVLRDQAKTGGSSSKPKPANIIEKIISGRINKVDQCSASEIYDSSRCWQIPHCAALALCTTAGCSRVAAISRGFGHDSAIVNVPPATQTKAHLQ